MEAPNENRSEAFEYLYRSYFGAEILEREEIERLPALLEGVEIFIDVGASLGQYTYFANRTMQNGRIIAIEADPARFAELEKNCDKWQAEGSNKITALFAACGDSNEPIQFFVTGGQISGGFFPVPERSDEYRPIDMQQVQLADFYEPGVSTFVKVDVEGAEFRVMRGAEKNIAGGHTRFLLEIAWWGDREQQTTARELLKWLEEHNLRIQKAARRHSSNYIVSPAAPGESARADYLHVRPLLLAKATYGRIVPASVRRARERALTRFRRKHHAKINQGADASV